MAVMATKRPRLYFDADEELKMLVRIATARRGFDSESACLAEVIREALKEDLPEARRALQQKKKREKNE